MHLNKATREESRELHMQLAMKNVTANIFVHRGMPRVGKGNGKGTRNKKEPIVGVK